MPEENFNKKRLGEKLKGITLNLIVDVWGIEKKAAETLHRYFESVSKQNALLKEKLTIRIRNDQQPIAELFSMNVLQHRIDTSDLFRIFNAPTLNQADLERLLTKTKDFLISCERNHKGKICSLMLRPISEKIKIQLVANDECLEDIPFPTLLKEMNF